MISINAAHSALLASLRPLVMVELMTITLLDGTVIRYCQALVPLSHGGYIYTPLNWERAEIVIKLGTEVDNVELTIWPKVYPVSARSISDQDLLAGLPWPQAVREKVLVGATILLQRGDIDPLAGPDIVGILYQFSGTVAEPSFGDGLKLVVKSDLEILNRQVPAQVYQPGCPYTTYDSRCGLNPNDWQVPGSVVSASSKTVINCSLSDADGYYTPGKVEFISGPNIGARRTIKSYVVGQLTLAGSLLFDPVIGDAFIAWPGCDKQRLTCGSKFSNTVIVNGVSVLRYGGQCFIPEPETAI